MDQYLTTYQRDYLWRDIKCPMGGHRMRVSSSDEPGKATVCKPKVYSGEATGRPYENPLGSCTCRAGGSLPPRGAVAKGLPNNLDKMCSCHPGPSSQKPAMNKEELAEMMYKAAETGNVKPQCTTCQNKQDLNPLRQPQKPTLGSRPCPQLIEPMQCPKPERFRPIVQGQFGGQYEGPINRELPEPPKEQTYTFDKPCYCPPDKPESGPQNYGQPWLRESARREEGVQIEPRMAGGKKLTVPPDVAKLVNQEPPAARVSCAPEADVSKFDQPNTFMRKLYEKYPYLYQILRDTPPEELIARVFKDRFLSTYQVDYLHMGVGKEAFQKGGEQMGERFVSPDGEEEPGMIPGCTYRANKKGDSGGNGGGGSGKQNFGKKKTGLKSKEKDDEDDEPIEVVKEEPRISEYMASISKLGGEIITDKLYEVDAQNRKQAASAKNKEL